MEIYHVFNRSIAGFRIFNNDHEFGRMLELLSFYRVKTPPIRFSIYNRASPAKKEQINNDARSDKKKKLVDIIAYCLMPTHLHMVLREKEDKGISVFMNNICNSYTRYFNSKHQRKGPLWETRFKRVAVDSDEQLLHLTRYIHLNPVTAYLVARAEAWQFSSYREYIGDSHTKLCVFNSLIDIDKDSYKIFVEDQMVYQRELAKIKSVVFD